MINPLGSISGLKSSVYVESLECCPKPKHFAKINFASTIKQRPDIHLVPLVDPIAAPGEVSLALAQQRPIEGRDVLRATWQVRIAFALSMFGFSQTWVVTVWKTCVGKATRTHPLGMNVKFNYAHSLFEYFRCLARPHLC